MPTAPISLFLDFLDSLAAGPRPYAEVMEAWRTSCPRLSVWEDAVIADLVRLDGAGGRAVTLTERGAAVTRQAQNQEARPVPAAPQRKRQTAFVETGS